MNRNGRVEEVEFFRFEEDFVEAGIRCIPMVVRFKLDAVGIKLKLTQWSRMTEEQRMHLAQAECESADDLIRYREDLYKIVQMQSREMPTLIPVEQNPSWSRTDEIPSTILERLDQNSVSMQLAQWQALTDLQRFALLKLSHSGHENKNFPKALAEFRISKV